MDLSSFKATSKEGIKITVQTQILSKANSKNSMKKTL